MLTKSSELQPVIKFANAWSKTQIYQKKTPPSNFITPLLFHVLYLQDWVSGSSCRRPSKQRTDGTLWLSNPLQNPLLNIPVGRTDDRSLHGDVLQSGGFSAHALVLIGFPAAAGFSHLIWSYPDHLQTTEFIRFLSFYFTFKKQHWCGWFSPNSSQHDALVLLKLSLHQVRWVTDPQRSHDS